MEASEARWTGLGSAAGPWLGGGLMKRVVVAMVRMVHTLGNAGMFWVAYLVNM